MSGKVLILGNGVAGFTAAVTVREQNQECEIVMMTVEGEQFYNRMLLSKALTDEKMLKDIYMKEEDWYTEHRIQNMLHCRITFICSEKKYVEYEDVCQMATKASKSGVEVAVRKRESYDVLIYALGANAFIPAIPGAGQRGVTAIRTIDDAKNAQELLKEANKIAIIGGGILGLEAAWQCYHAGKEVVIIEAANRLMEKQLDQEGSEFLLHLLMDKGIQVMAGKTVMEIVTDMEKAAISGVLVADAVKNMEEHEIAGITESQATQQTVECDMVIVACGIVPNTKVAMESGLGIGTGVIVDEHLKTTVDSIYACGDCAQMKDHKDTHGLWTEAKQMGEVAGKNAAAFLNGEPQKAVYEQGRAAFYFRGLDTVIFSIGQIGSKRDSLTDWAIRRGIEHEEYRDGSAGRYEKYYYHGEDMVGAILIGAPDKISEVNERIGIMKESYMDC